VCAGALSTVFAKGQKPVEGIVLLAYAREYHLEMLIGQYDPASRRWLPDSHAFIPPPVQAPFTLFGVEGRLGQVVINETFRTPRSEQPWDWNVAISSWNRSDTRVALAVSGEWPPLPRAAQALPLDDAAATTAVADFLKARRVPVAHPRLTQVLRVDLNGDGREETLVCANSDNAALMDAAPAAVYALALLVVDVNGKTAVLPLRADASYKPANRRVDEHQRLYGRFGTYQVLAVVDIAGDGREQVAVLNDNRSEGPEVDVYALAGEKVTRLLSTRKLYQ
jgi:hypothetical protein